MKKIWKQKRLFLLLLAPFSFILSFAASQNPNFAEWYATTVYPVLSHIINAATSLLPFSLAEVLVLLLVPALILLVVRFVVRLIRKKGNRPGTAARFFLNLLCTVSVLAFIFTLNCGINYSRYPFAQTSGLKVQDSSKAELTALCEELAQKVSALRTRVQTDSRSVMKLSQPTLRDTAEEARKAYDKIGVQYPLLTPGYGAPKAIFGSRYMSYTQTTGIFIPFTFEANVNVDIPAYSIPATMCHELSHLRGYMREDEANFIGYLVCENSGSTDFEYSGDMLAFIYTYNALCTVDGEAAGRIYATLDEGVQRDLAANSVYWKQFEGPVAQVSTSVNDSYLKANRQGDGVKSYGRMVDLLLAEHHAKAGK